MGGCVECGRPMRPRNTTLKQYPGTVSYNGRRCSPCTARASKANAKAPVEPVPVVCSRCGVTEMFTGGRARKYELCRDCRDVLPRVKWDAWAA